MPEEAAYCCICLEEGHASPRCEQCTVETCEECWGDYLERQGRLYTCPGCRKKSPNERFTPPRASTVRAHDIVVCIRILELVYLTLRCAVALFVCVLCGYGAWNVTGKFEEEWRIAAVCVCVSALLCVSYSNRMCMICQR